MASLPNLSLLRLAVAGSLATVLALAAPSLEAQTVTGVVLDAETQQPVAGAELTLRSDGGRAVAQDETGEDGSFTLATRQAGTYTLEVNRLDYASPPSRRIALDREIVEVEVLLSRSPLELEPITVTERRHDPRHDATLQGALVRHHQLPRVGNRRVVLREDAELRGAIRLTDVLRWFPPGRGCTIIYWNGRVQNHPALATQWMDESASHFEAVEFYRWYSDAPRGLRDVPSYVLDPSGCSVVALWPRLPDGRDRGPAWHRALMVGGAAALLLGLKAWLLGG